MALVFVQKKNEVEFINYFFFFCSQIYKHNKLIQYH